MALGESRAVVDVHTHLTDKQFDKENVEKRGGLLAVLTNFNQDIESPCDVDDVISQARQAGVAAALVVSESVADFSRVLDLADRHPSFVVPCLGLHPVQTSSEEGGGDVSQRSVTVKDLEEAETLLDQHSHRLAAIGEVGLDFTPRWCKTPEDKAGQREVLSRQVQLALKYDLPLNVHSRSAGQPTINLLKEHGVSKAVLHAFDGRASAAMSGVQCGYYFSIPPSINRSLQKQKLVSAVPLSNLLLETDSPALGPEKMVRNVPENISISYEWIAQIKKISVEEVREVTTQNAIKLFPALAKLIKI